VVKCDLCDEGTASAHVRLVDGTRAYVCLSCHSDLLSQGRLKEVIEKL
jgi:predicted CXXCH cytochrome family protein